MTVLFFDFDFKYLKQEGITDWRNASSNLLVAVGSRLPDVVRSLYAVIT